MPTCTVVSRCMMWYVAHLANRVPPRGPWTIERRGAKGSEHVPDWRKHSAAMHCINSRPNTSAGK
eukprot:285207-Pyramimonas_sp.AAC.1